MLGDDNYYVPTKDEFYPGVEFEVNTKSVGLGILDTEQMKLVHKGEMTPVWTKCTFSWEYVDITQSPFNFDLVLEDKRIRIKYLDGDDIMSLGFEIANDEANTYRSLKKQLGAGSGDDKTLFIQHDIFPIPSGELRISTHIWWRENRGTEITMFEGSIKNKSELKKILKQIHADSITKEQ